MPITSKYGCWNCKYWWEASIGGEGICFVWHKTADEDFGCDYHIPGTPESSLMVSASGVKRKQEILNEILKKWREENENSTG